MALNTYIYIYIYTPLELQGGVHRVGHGHVHAAHEQVAGHHGAELAGVLVEVLPM